MEPKTRPVNLSDIWQQIARHPLIVLGTTALFVLLAVIGSVLMPVSYKSEATVQVSPVTTTPFSSAMDTRQVNMATERQLISSEAVLGRAAKALGEGVEATDLRDSMTTSNPQGSLLLRAAVTARKPQEAADKAQAIAQAYLEHRSGTVRAQVEAMSKDIDARLKQLKPDSQQAIDLSAQRAALTSLPSNTGYIVDPAPVPTEPATPGIVVYITGGLIAGLLLGAAAAIWVDRARTQVRNVATLTRITGKTPVPLGTGSEPYRWLRTALLERDSSLGMRGSIGTVAILSVFPADPEPHLPHLMGALGDAVILGPTEPDVPAPLQAKFAATHGLAVILVSPLALTSRVTQLAATLDSTPGVRVVWALAQPLVKA